MRRRWMVVSLLVVAALLAGCLANTLARRVKQTVAAQIGGETEGGVTKEGSQSPTQKAQSEETPESEGESTEEPEEPTVDPSTLKPGTPLQGECFKGFMLYPGATENEDAKSMSRILAGAFESPQTRGYATKDSVEHVKAFYNAKPADAGWEAAPIQGGQRGGGVYYWGKEAEKILIITLVSGDSKTKLTMISMVCGQTK